MFFFSLVQRDDDNENHKPARCPPPLPRELVEQIQLKNNAQQMLRTADYSKELETLYHVLLLQLNREVLWWPVSQVRFVCAIIVATRPVTNFILSYWYHARAMLLCVFSVFWFFCPSSFDLPSFSLSFLPALFALLTPRRPCGVCSGYFHACCGRSFLRSVLWDGPFFR